MWSSGVLVFNNINLSNVDSPEYVIVDIFSLLTMSWARDPWLVHMSGAGLGPDTGWIPWPVLVISRCWHLTQLTLRLTMATRDLEAKRREAEGSGDAFQGEPVQVSSLKIIVIVIDFYLWLYIAEKNSLPQNCVFDSWQWILWKAVILWHEIYPQHIHQSEAPFWPWQKHHNLPHLHHALLLLPHVWSHDSWPVPGEVQNHCLHLSYLCPGTFAQNSGCCTNPGSASSVSRKQSI